MLTQRQKVSPPVSVDKASLQDFASVTQQAFDDVFQAGHTHDVRIEVPSSTEGNPGDIVPVTLSGIPYLYVKFKLLGWKRVLLT